uniref:p55 C-terminal domain-containing protein n=1 Tax=Emaravirus tritici TaxID=1980428 RepID=A0A7T8D0L4_9VIRU|nr:P5 hypothetical protein [Emaravirus tritici]
MDINKSCGYKMSRMQVKRRAVYEAEVKAELVTRRAELDALKGLIKDCKLDLTQYHGRNISLIDPKDIVKRVVKVTTWEPKSGKVRGLNILGMYRDALVSQILNEALENKCEDKIICNTFEMCFLVDIVSIYELNPSELFDDVVERFDELISEYRFTDINEAVRSCGMYYDFYKSFINKGYMGTREHFVLVEKYNVYSSMIKNMDPATHFDMSPKLYGLLEDFVKQYHGSNINYGVVQIKEKLNDEEFEHLRYGFNKLIKPIEEKFENRINYLGRTFNGYEKYGVNEIPLPGVDIKTDFFYYKIPISTESFVSVVGSACNDIKSKDDIDETSYGSKYIPVGFRAHVYKQVLRLNSTIKMSNLALYLMSYNILEYCRIFRIKLDTEFEPRLLTNVRVGTKKFTSEYKVMINELKGKSGFVVNKVLELENPILPIAYYDSGRNVRPTMRQQRLDLIDSDSSD